MSLVRLHIRVVEDEEAEETPGSIVLVVLVPSVHQGDLETLWARHTVALALDAVPDGVPAGTADL